MDFKAWPEVRYRADCGGSWHEAAVHHGAAVWSLLEVQLTFVQGRA
jgi:hypothetical protein